MDQVVDVHRFEGDLELIDEVGVDDEAVVEEEIVLAAVAMVGFVGQSFAADLPARMPPVVAISSPTATLDSISRCSLARLFCGRMSRK